MSVNYLVEINALNDWELCHPLSATAYKVLLKLYHLANKERFPERITVPNRVLMSMVGCSEDSLIKARNQLIQNGRIDYKGQKKLTPIYMIHYFSSNITANNPEIQSFEHGYQQGIKQGMQHGFQHSIKHGTYINNTKQGEIKENRDIYTDDAELRILAEAIAEQNGHKGNIAYIEGIQRKLTSGGANAVMLAKEEIQRGRNAIGTQNAMFQTHGYTEADFGDDFYYDPVRDFTGVTT